MTMGIPGTEGFVGQSVVVTGGANGIGKAIVQGFVERKATVLAVDMKEDDLRRLQHDLPQVSTLVIDITHADAPEAIVAAAGHHIDVLCNNAGMLDRLGWVDETTDEEWDRLFAVHARAPFRLCRRVVPLMASAGGGAIVNTASIAGLSGGRAGAAYTASKFALVGLTLNIAATWGEAGIRCNAVAPGSVMGTGIGNGISFTERGASTILRDSKQPSPGDPPDIAAVVVFLASTAARHINGAIVPVDAGTTAF